MRRTGSVVSLIAFLIFQAPFSRAQHTITTVAGGVPNNLPALQVGLGGPLVVSRDSAGNLFVGAGGLMNAIYKIDASGQLTTVAGNGTDYGFSGDGGPATSAGIRSPGAVYVDGSGNIFIADTYNDRIREVVAATGNIQTVAGNGTYGFSGDGGPAASAELSSPAGVFVDTAGNIFIADSGNLRIREVVAATGNIQTVAGSGSCCGGGDGGPATSAALGVPLAVFGDGSGDIFFAETDAGGRNRIREVVAATGNIQTVAGNGTNGFSGDGGPATSAALGFPTGVFVDRSGNIFIADTTNNRIREVLAATGIIRTVAGNGMPSFSGDGGPATSGGLVDPTGVLVDDAGNIFIADGNRIREVAAASGTIQTVAGNGTCCFSADGGPATSSELAFIYGGGVSVDRSGNIFIADPQDSRIREVVAATGNIRTVAGNGTNGFSGDGGPATSAELDFPVGIFVDRSGNIFTVDGNRVREVDAAAGNIQTVAGNGTFAFSGDGGPATSAGIGPASAYADSAGNIMITDSANSRVREVVAATGNIQTVAGNGATSFSGDGGPATRAALSHPHGVFGDASGNIFIADAGNQRIREVVAATGNIQTVAGNGQFAFSGDGGPATGAGVDATDGLFVDSAGNIFIADYVNNRVRKVDAATGIIQTVAGNGVGGLNGDGGSATSAELFFPSSVFGDRQGNLLIVDSGNNRIRRVTGLVAVVGVGVAPGTSTVTPGATQQFTATVTNAINIVVTWSLSETGCTGSGCGTISPQGLYTAPSATGSPLTVTVTATSVADDTKSATATVTVPARQASSVAVSSSANPSVLGQAITLTATVHPSSGSSMPTGSVTFQDGAAILGTAPLDSSGSATLTASALAVAAHPITATYSGDNGFFGSTGTLTENVSYAFHPLYSPTRAVPSGAAFPIKLYLCDAGGKDVSSAAVALHASGITSASGYSGGAASPSNANPGGNFRFDASLGPAGGYIFNLKTTGLALGTYSLQFTAGSDPIPHAANFAVRQSQQQTGDHTTGTR